jgi:hypothetical protein
LQNIESNTEQMKNTTIHVCARAAFVGWPSTESRRISCFYNFLSFSHYFWNSFKLMKKCGHGNFNHWYNIYPIHLHALLGVGNFMKVVHVCADGPWSGLRLPKFWDTLLYTI